MILLSSWLFNRATCICACQLSYYGCCLRKLIILLSHWRDWSLCLFAIFLLFWKSWKLLWSLLLTMMETQDTHLI